MALVMIRYRLAQRKRAQCIRVTEPPMFQRPAGRIERSFGRGVARLPHSHGDNWKTGIPTTRRFRQHVHRMKGLHSAAVRERGHGGILVSLVDREIDEIDDPAGCHGLPQAAALHKT